METLDELIIRLNAAKRDEMVDGRRADRAYMKGTHVPGRFYAKESRRSYLMQQIIERKIRRTTA